MPDVATVPMFDSPDEAPANLPAEAADAYRKEPVGERWRARADSVADRCCCCGDPLPNGRLYLCDGCEAGPEAMAALDRLILRLRAERAEREAACPGPWVATPAG